MQVIDLRRSLSVDVVHDPHVCHAGRFARSHWRAVTPVATRPIIGHVRDAKILSANGAIEMAMGTPRASEDILLVVVVVILAVGRAGAQLEAHDAKVLGSCGGLKAADAVGDALGVLVKVLAQQVRRHGFYHSVLHRWSGDIHFSLLGAATRLSILPSFALCA
jgi:hypothetical protein